MPAEELLPKLFVGHAIRLFAARPVSHDCRCTPERLAGVVQMLGADEVKTLSKSKSKPELLGDVVAAMYGPGSTIAAQLKGPGSKIAGAIKALVFVGAMLLGMGIFELIERRKQASPLRAA